MTSLNKIINCKQSWEFILPELIPIRIPIQIKATNDKKVKFLIPYGETQMEFTLENNKSVKGKKINATYCTLNNEMKGSIEFAIQEKGKLLIGRAIDIRGGPTWVIERKK